MKTTSNPSRKRITSGSTLEQEYAYSRAVVDGRWVLVSGTTGYNYSTMAIDPDPAVQATQCFKNIEAALAEAGAELEDVVRVTYLVTNRNDVPLFAPIFQKFLGDVLPAATLMVTELLDTDMKIEIEVTALLRAT